MKLSLPGVEIVDKEDIVSTLRTVKCEEREFNCDTIVILSICLSSYVKNKYINKHEKRAWASDLKVLVFESLRSVDIIDVGVATSAMLDIQRYASSDGICVDSEIGKYYNQAISLVVGRWLQLAAKRMVTDDSTSKYQPELVALLQLRDRDLLIEEDNWRREMNAQLDCADEPW